MAQALRILLIIAVTFLALAILGCPGLYHSTRTTKAVGRYIYHPSEETRHGLREAKRIDRREVLYIQLFLGGLVLFCVAGFIRAGKNMPR
jgi:hypothetical protein